MLVNGTNLTITQERNMKSLKERATEQYKGWKKTPTKEAQSAFDAIMDKAAIDQGLENLTIYESPKKGAL